MLRALLARWTARRRVILMQELLAEILRVEPVRGSR